MKQKAPYSSLEWVGVITAIAYSLLVASNVGLEFIGFMLLLISAVAIAGLIGMVRWF